MATRGDEQVDRRLFGLGTQEEQEIARLGCNGPLAISPPTLSLRY